MTCLWFRAVSRQMPVNNVTVCDSRCDNGSLPLPLPVGCLGCHQMSFGGSQMMMVVRGVRKSRRGARAVECAVPGRWVVVSESWGCDQVQYCSYWVTVRGVEACLTYGYLHMYTCIYHAERGTYDKHMLFVRHKSWKPAANAFLPPSSQLRGTTLDDDEKGYFHRAVWPVRESPRAEAHCKPKPCADCSLYPQHQPYRRPNG